MNILCEMKGKFKKKNHVVRVCTNYVIFTYQKNKDCNRCMYHKQLLSAVKLDL